MFPLLVFGGASEQSGRGGEVIFFFFVITLQTKPKIPIMQRVEIEFFVVFVFAQFVWMTNIES